MFTPLEGPAAYSGDEDEIPFGANTGFKALCEPPPLEGYRPSNGVYIEIYRFCRAGL